MKVSILKNVKYSAVLFVVLLTACLGGGGGGGTAVAPVAPNPALGIEYFKASNTEQNSYFGHSAAISADGSILAVGAYSEDGAGTDRGAVYMYRKIAGVWAEEAVIIPGTPEDGQVFGWSVALSADGSILAVGAYAEDGAGTNRGAAYVYSGVNWATETAIVASTPEDDAWFGYSVALSDDGSVLAVGALLEDSGGTDRGTVYVYNGALWATETIFPAPIAENGFGFGNSISLSDDGSILAVAASGADGLGTNRGAVYVYSGALWAAQELITAGIPEDDAWFGTSVALSDDGSVLAVGAYAEDGMGTDRGAVYVYNGVNWADETPVTASNAEDDDYFGWSVSLSGDGGTLAVGAYGEDSDAIGVDGSQVNNLADSSGAVYLFSFNGFLDCPQTSYVKASNTGDGDRFGYSVSLDLDGSTLAVGADNEDGDGSVAESNSGAAYVY